LNLIEKHQFVERCIDSKRCVNY